VLRFRLFDMPVTVRGSFLLIAAVIGLIGVGDAAQTVAWIVVVFFSILIHELGHAVTARAFGSEVAIELNGLGGLTRWSLPQGEITPGRRALIAAAGSATGLAFGGLVWLVASQFGPYARLTAFALESLIYVNVFWGLLNWLPIRPLDGGHLLESFLEKVAPRRAEIIARVVFTATAAIALAIALLMQLYFIAALAGWLLLSEFTIGRETPQPSPGLPVFSYDDSDGEAAEPGETRETVEVIDPDDGDDAGGIR
jgi:stage IV sporulation protein FB